MFYFRTIAGGIVLSCTVVVHGAFGQTADSAAATRERIQVLEKQRRELARKINLASLSGKETYEQAAQHKKELQKAREACVETKKIAIDAIHGRGFHQVASQMRKEAREKLEAQAATRREMIKRNEPLIKQSRFEAGEFQRHLGEKSGTLRPLELAEQAAGGKLDPPTKARLDAARAEYAELAGRMNKAKQMADFLEGVNNGARAYVQAVEHIPPPGMGGGYAAPKDVPREAVDLQKWLAEYKDAAQQEKHAWSTSKDWWEKVQAENDWARRVAAEVILGMDRAIIESMNPEAVLIEASPELKIERMNDLINTYDKMIADIDAHVKELQEAEKFQAMLPQLQAELKALDAQILELKSRFIVSELPRGMVNEDVLDRLLSHYKASSGYSVDDELRYAILREFQRTRQAWLVEVLSILNRLEGQQIALSSTPSLPLVWPPDAKKLDVEVFVQDGTLDSDKTRIIDLLRRLTGLSPKISVEDDWTYDKQTESTNRAVTRGITVTFDKQEPKTVQAVRRITVSVTRPFKHACPLELAAVFSNRTVKMKTGQLVLGFSDTPADIAGRWSGQMTVSTFVIDGGPGQQGCDLSAKLAGKSAPLTLDIQGAVAAGTLVFTCKPPAEQQGDMTSRMGYSTAGSKFSASGGLNNGTMTLSGTFALTPEGNWTIAGQWSWAMNREGQRGRAAGNWSAALPKARKQ